MANFLGNFVLLTGVPVFYFQNLVTLVKTHNLNILQLLYFLN
jgi:hypothetical protein